MRVWFTRPSTWDLQVQGIERCEMWLRKPFFEQSPRGEERDPLYPHLPWGWRVLDRVYGDVADQFSITVRAAFRSRQYEDVEQALWTRCAARSTARGQRKAARRQGGGWT